MTAIEPSLDGLPAGLGRALASRYGVAPIESARRLEGGYLNDLYRVDAGSAVLVVRVERRQANAHSVAWEHALLAFLAPRLPEVVAPIPALDGSTFFVHAGRAVSLLPFVEGRPAGRGDRREHAAAATLLGRLHSALVEYDASPRPGRPSLVELDWALPPSLPPSLEPHRRRLEDEAARMREWVRAVACSEAPPATAAIHGDFYPGNVLVDEGRVCGLVDWEEAHVDWTAYELANGMWEFCRRGDDFDRDAAREFIAVYRSAGGVVPPEQESRLVPLIRCRRLVELFATAWCEEPFADGEYALHNLRALANLAAPDVG
ncbi:MAG: phosphotransferase [Actinomycetota bacterium]|nr:phosphotransferase [Actinomycetota bacterium]